MNKKYQVIYADPPWRQKKGGLKNVRTNSSGKELEYPVIDLTEIRNHFWSVINYRDNNSILFLWTIDKYLFQAQKLAEEFAWKLHARMIWNKVTGIPAAFTIRFGHEYLLFMHYGKLLPIAKKERGKIHSVFTEQVRRHSEKPQIAYEIIERLYPDANKLEMYARKKRDGWDVWGIEVESDINL